ncbi:hypothetical protein ACWDA3_23840 [Nonomuraea rubra]
MTSDLANARDRLVPLHRLHQVATLLNMPQLGETATQADTPQINQHAALYADIADWARLSAHAAQLLRDPDPGENAGPFVYLIEYTDQHTKGWRKAPGEHTNGCTLAERAETVAQTVLTRYLTHLADHRDDYELWLVDSLTLRANVWHMVTADAHPRGRRSSWPSSACTFQEAKIFPHAIEIRTPAQIQRFMDHHIGSGET